MKKKLIPLALVLALFLAAAIPGARADWFVISSPYDFYSYSAPGTDFVAGDEPLFHLYTEEELVQKFEELKVRFPAGSYWNHAVDAPYTDEEGQLIRSVYESVTDHPCDDVTYTCKGQCIGFAWMLADIIYCGQSTGNSYATPGYTPMDPDEVTELRPGDIISVHSASLGHEAIVYQVKGDTVYVAECWGSSRSGCKINWKYFNGAKKNATLAGIRETAEGGLYIFRRPPTVAEYPAYLEAHPVPKAYPSTQTVLVNGNPVEFQMFALKDENGNATNYVKLRELAQALNGTSSQFNVTWDGSVKVLFWEEYVPNGTEDLTPFPPDQPQPFRYLDQPTIIHDGKQYLDAIVLTDAGGGGHTYYQLRQLQYLLNYKVDWSAENGISITPNKPYWED